MINRYNKILLPFFFLIDIIIVCFSFFIAYYFRFGELVFLNSEYTTVLMSSLILWSFLSIVFKTYHEHHGNSLIDQLSNLIISKAFFLLGLTLYIFASDWGFISRAFVGIFFIIDVLLTITFHTLRHQVMLQHRRGGANYKSVMLLGDLPKNGSNGKSNFFSPETGHKIKKHLGLLDMLKNINDIPDLIREEIENSDYDILLIASPLEFGKHLYSIVDVAENHGLRVSFYPQFIKSLNHKIEVNYIDQIPLLNVRTEPLKFLHNKFLKRTLDLFIAGLIFIFFYWWFYLIVGALIKLSSRGPILFKQKRIGVNDKEFWCYKFRTMKHPQDVEKAQNGGRCITRKCDPRITKIGACLRKTNLDELPQIINVLKGDMSLVGPRPHMLEEDHQVRKEVPKYMIRQFIKPGITGWAAINGYRGGTTDIKQMQKRIEHDIYYIEFWSLWFDIKILGITLWQMITFNIPNAY
mgnify:CR=1 FL=1